MSENYINKHPLVTEAMETILNIGDEFINKIPEDVFVARYLPMLMNSNNELVNLQEWIAIAGHVFAEVDVVGKDGAVLFRVPSVLRRLKTKEHKHAQQSVLEIIELSKLHSQNSPHKGDRIMEEGLTTTLPQEVIKKDDNERWIAILKRYSYNVDGENKIVESVSIPTVDKISFDDCDLA